MMVCDRVADQFGNMGGTAEDSSFCPRILQYADPGQELFLSHRNKVSYEIKKHYFQRTFARNSVLSFPIYIYVFSTGTAGTLLMQGSDYPAGKESPSYTH